MDAGAPVFQKVGFSDLDIAVEGGHSVVRVVDGSSVTVESVTDLAATDFLFA